MKALLGKAKIAGDQGWAKRTTARNLGGVVRGAWRGLLSRSSAGGRDLPSELLCSFSLCLSLSIGLNKAVVSTIRHRFRLFRSAVPRWLFYCPTTIQKLLRGFRPEAWSSGSEPAALLWPLGACPTSPHGGLGWVYYPHSQAQLPKSKHCFPGLGGFLFQNIKLGWKIRKFYPTKRFLSFQEKKVLEQISKKSIQFNFQGDFKMIIL